MAGIYAVIVFVALVGEYGLRVIVDWLNLRAMAPQPPA